MKTIRIIEQYLDGTLNEEQMHAVEERAARDTDFREQIRLHREVNSSIRDKDLWTFRDLLKKTSTAYIHTSGETLPGIRVRNKQTAGRFMLRIAAFLILAMAAGAILRFVIFRSMPPSVLYKKYYTVYSADAVVRSSQADVPDIDRAIQLYDLGRAGEALVLLDQIVRNDSANVAGRFYKGLALMETGDPANAIGCFRELPVNLPYPYGEPRDWYLALALLKENRIQEASAVLQHIDTGGGQYARMAKQMLKKIRN